MHWMVITIFYVWDILFYDNISVLGQSLKVAVTPFVVVTHHRRSVDKADKFLPIILWWTDRIYSYDAVQEIKCYSGSICYSSKDRRLMNDPRTRLFYFYGSDIDPRDLPIPRNKNHLWALFHEESPMINYMLSHGSMLKPFNYTATFKRESDFPVTTSHIPDSDYITKRKPVPIYLKNLYRREGLAPIVYVQSQCNVASDRDRYVEQLMKYIAVDSYGQCVNNKIMPFDINDPVQSMSSPDFHSFLAKYKFQLAYENAICDDYMSEKLFRSFHIGSVPIYKGSKKVKDWAPSDKSIILIDDFDTPEDLAYFIKYLDSFDELYEQYLDFKTNGIKNNFLLKTIKERSWSINDNIKPNMHEDFECYLCDKLTKIFKSQQQSAHNINDKNQGNIALTSHMNCPQPYPSYGEINDLTKQDSWMQQRWIDDYWYGYDIANAINKMIAANETMSAKLESYFHN